jgi:hypothetical protein
MTAFFCGIPQIYVRAHVWADGHVPSATLLLRVPIKSRIGAQHGGGFCLRGGMIRDNVSRRS